MEPGLRIHDARYEQAEPAAIRALQERRLLDMVRFAYATNAFYRERWDAAGVDLDRVGSIEAFSAALPMVEKKDFVDDQLAHPPFGRRLERAFALGERLEVYTTSGTSGQGVELHAQTERELDAMVAMYRYMFRWAGLNPGDVALMTLPITMLGGGRIEWQGAVGYGLTVLPAGNVDVKAKLALVERFRPKALYGSTSYFGHMLAVAEDAVPKDSVEVLLTGLEGAGFSYLEQLGHGWGAFVGDRFGCTQLRSDFMFTCEHGVGTAARPGLLHNIDPYILLEVIDPETGRHVADGEFGEMVVTSLYHWDNPVIRCRLRDGGVWHGAGYCGCGRPFGGIEVASISRTDDVKKVKGINIYPAAVDDVVFSFAEVDEYQVVLTSNDHLADVATVQVMTKGMARSGLVEELGHRLHQRIGIHFGIELADELPRSEYKARRWRDERVR